MKKEEKKEKKEIKVLDEGIDMNDIMGPDWYCCRGAFMPIR